MKKELIRKINNYSKKISTLYLSCDVVTFLKISILPIIVIFVLQTQNSVQRSFHLLTIRIPARVKLLLCYPVVMVGCPCDGDCSVVAIVIVMIVVEIRGGWTAFT